MKLKAPSVENFEKCPAGNHLAVCTEIIDLGTQETTYKDETKKQRKVWIGWETPHETNEEGKPFRIGRRYTFSGNERSNLRKDIESWRGKAFTQDELDNGFDIQSLIGKACFLNVVHVEKGDSVYANIQSVAALPKGTTAPEPVNETVYFSLEPEEFDAEVFGGLSDRMKQTISASPEFAAVAADVPF